MSTLSRDAGDAGFSLVEALVALAVFATAGVALVTMQTQSVRTLTAQESRTLGALVAQNVLVDVVASDTPPSIGQSAGDADLGGRTWSWRMDVFATQDPGMRRVRVIVRDGAAPAADVTAFAKVPVTQ